MERNWYAVLGLTATASDIEIKRAFRKLAHIYHPDKNSNPIYFEQFKQIKKAYEILGNPIDKKLYDKSLQLAGDQALKQPPLNNLKDLIQYFHFFERELQQTDFRFINYDRIQWKLNYPFAIPQLNEQIQMGSSVDQQILLNKILYCVSFLPFNLITPYIDLLKEGFHTPIQLAEINHFSLKKRQAFLWETLKVPIVAIISLLLCLGIYLLAQ
jgi:curved DNA-binding protein CbpA